MIGDDNCRFGRDGNRDIDGPLNYTRGARHTEINAWADCDVGGQASLQGLLAGDQL